MIVHPHIALQKAEISQVKTRKYDSRVVGNTVKYISFILTWPNETGEKMGISGLTTFEYELEINKTFSRVFHKTKEDDGRYRCPCCDVNNQYNQLCKSFNQQAEMLLERIMENEDVRLRLMMMWLD